MSDTWYEMTQKSQEEYIERTKKATVVKEKEEEGLNEFIKITIECFNIDPEKRPSIKMFMENKWIQN